MYYLVRVLSLLLQPPRCLIPITHNSDTYNSYRSIIPSVVLCLCSAVNSVSVVVLSYILTFLKARVWITHIWCQSVEHEQWSAEGVFCVASGKGIGVSFHSSLGYRQLHRLCCEKPLISGGRGWTHPAQTYSACHNEYSLSVNHSLIPSCIRSYLHTPVS